MIAQLSDGSLHEVATPVDLKQVALVTGDLILDGLYNDDDVVPVRMSAIVALHNGRGVPRPDLDGLIDAILDQVPGRRP